jgi:hypothetical protein
VARAKLARRALAARDLWRLQGHRKLRQGAVEVERRLIVRLGHGRPGVGDEAHGLVDGHQEGNRVRHGLRRDGFAID